MENLRRNWILFCAFAALVPTAYSQTATGEFSGTVLDASGAVVASAKVTATSVETGAAREVRTDQGGNYVLTFLQPGLYNLSAEAPGFRKTVQNNIELRINQRAEVNLALQVGQVTEVAEVTGAAPLLENQSSSLGTVIDTQLTSELPLNGRNFVQLATLSPGVNGTGYSVSGTIMSGTRPDDRRPGTEIFSNGNREGSNDFLYDGIDNNDRLTLSIVLRPGVEAIREFKVQTNLFSADQGRNSGAVVDVVTKSGTNSWHGSAFEFLRNSAMDARSFFNTVGQPFPSFRYNQFGGSFGRSGDTAQGLQRQGQNIFLRRLRRIPQESAANSHRDDSDGSGTQRKFQRFPQQNLRSYNHCCLRLLLHAHAVSGQS